MLIKIDNLTKSQCTMLDKIWSCDTHDEFLSWHKNLNDQDQVQASTLLCLLEHEIIERDIKNFNQANQVLKQFQL